MYKRHDGFSYMDSLTVFMNNEKKTTNKQNKQVSLTSDGPKMKPTKS